MNNCWVTVICWSKSSQNNQWINDIVNLFNIFKNMKYSLKVQPEQKFSECTCIHIDQFVEEGRFWELHKHVMGYEKKILYISLGLEHIYGCNLNFLCLVSTCKQDINSWKKNHLPLDHSIEDEMYWCTARNRACCCYHHFNLYTLLNKLLLTIKTT